MDSVWKYINEFQYWVHISKYTCGVNSHILVYFIQLNCHMWLKWQKTFILLLPQSLSRFYGGAVQTEDYASQLDRIPVSSVALQFIVNVYRSDYNCTSQPRFSYFTRRDKSCIGVEFNKTHTEILFATTGTKEEMWVSCIWIFFYHPHFWIISWEYLD